MSADVQSALAWARARGAFDRIRDTHLLTYLPVHPRDPRALWRQYELATVRAMLRADDRALRVLITYRDGVTVRVKCLLPEGWSAGVATTPPAPTMEQETRDAA